MTTDGGGWTLVLNLATGEGGRHDWNDSAFWTAVTTDGIAANAMTNDYMGTAFDEVTADSELMVYVHNEGIAEYGFAVYPLLGDIFIDHAGALSLNDTAGWTAAQPSRALGPPSQTPTTPIPLPVWVLTTSKPDGERTLSRRLSVPIVRLSMVMVGRAQASPMVGATTRTIRPVRMKTWAVCLVAG